MPSLQRTKFLDDFRCLGDQCEDTCCKGWGMQIDALMVEKYRADAPELLDAVTTGEADLIMRRDEKTDYCVKFDNGWCGIHKKHGDSFLGDACHFFPRITRNIESQAFQTASLSCPEVVRCILRAESPFTVTSGETDRLPQELREYCPPQMDAATALVTHQAFITAIDDPSVTAERSLCRIVTTAQSLENLSIESWPQAVGFYLGNADARLSAPEANPVDPFFLLQALMGLVAAARPSARPRLEKVIADIKTALALPEDFNHASTLTLQPENLDRTEQLQTGWNAKASSLQLPLKRWLQAQLSMSFFPFAGFGDSLPHRAAVIGIRLATLKLALMAEIRNTETLNEAEIVRLIQSLSRFLDHLADPTLSLRIYQETGWLKPARLRALLGDN